MLTDRPGFDLVRSALDRLSDVDGADDSDAQPGTGGHTDLVALTREELFALDDQPAFGDTGSLAWWGGLDPGTRTELLAAAQRGLLARRLVGSTVDPTQVAVHPHVALVLAVRSLPAFLTVQGVVGNPEPTTRAYGILDEDRAVAAVLLERRIVPGVSDFVLATPAYAALALTRYLFEPPDAADPSATAVNSPLQRVVRRRLESLLPGEASGRRHLAYAAVTAGAIARVEADGSVGVPEPVTEAVMIDFLLAEWDALAQRVRVGLS